MNTFCGLKIIQSSALTKYKEDWSQVRSPARARRRRWKHKQNIKYVESETEIVMFNGIIYTSPASYRAILIQAVAMKS